MNGLIKRLLKGGSGDKPGDKPEDKPEDKPITYEEARELARNEDVETRRELAARSDIQPEILYFLAEDPVPEVRRAIATNQAAPAHADKLLCRDADEDVRGVLAGKIAALAPELSAEEQDNVRAMAYETLETLARDQITRVRQILSEALKDVAGAPPEVIGRLARDAELVVSGPMLRFSPVLTDEDLLEIIEANPATGPLGEISKRSGVGETVVDAIVETDDEEAVAFLLANASAQIREETLDRIIDRAPDIEPWHAPLVNRPQLPSRTAAKLARFVAHDLLETLSEREDLEPEVLDEVREVVARRLEEDAPAAGEGEKSTAEEAMEKAWGLHGEGNLDESAVAEALKTGDRELVIAALAVRSGLKVDAVRNVVSTRSAKGIVTVAWKAGLSPKFAEALQQKLALVGAKDVLRADGEDFPLDTQDLEWQLDFIKDLG